MPVAKPKSLKPKDAPQITLGVTFGGVSFGKDTVRVSVRTSRGAFTPAQADRLLCGRRLKVYLMAVPSGRPDQPAMPGAETPPLVEVVGLADAKAYSCSPRFISFGLTFVIAEEMKDQLPDLVGLDGQVSIYSSVKLAEEDKGGDEE